MFRLSPTSNTVLREYVGPTALGLALVVCMPVVGIAAFLLRGVVVALFAVAIAAATTVALWQLIEPTLSPGCRLAVREAAIGVATLACIPLLVIVLFVAQSTVVALLAVAAVTLAIIGIWRIIAAGRHVFRTH